ncbi:hypothetical protein AG4045_010233 [Apium graveolens]|uniref:C2H2-type domain-containing protein n=1 Tax=Apium graveolens TaxID=4045 RepID=A0A6L5B740_APIGR|nr:hypothetical protein AG4045_010233 [Apium graveolens]
MIRYLGNGFNEQAKKVDDYDSVPVMKKSVTEEGGSSDHVTKDCNIGFVGQEGNANANGVDHVVENHHVGVVSDGMNTELVLGLVGGHSQFDGINGKDNHGEKMVMGNSKINKDKKIRVKTGLKPPGVGSSVGVAGASTAADKYKCTTCDKTFSSHQALGGHRSSHNKFKVTIINGDSSAKESFSAFAPPGQMFDHHQQQQQFNTSHDQVNRVPMSDEECATKRNSIDEVVGSSKANEHISSTVHQCSVCNKIFASGQALGGHKRCHWTAPPAGAQTAEQAQPQLEAQMAMKSIRLPERMDGCSYSPGNPTHCIENLQNFAGKRTSGPHPLMPQQVYLQVMAQFGHAS